MTLLNYFTFKLNTYYLIVYILFSMSGITKSHIIKKMIINVYQYKKKTTNKLGLFYAHIIHYITEKSWDWKAVGIVTTQGTA